MEGRLEEWRGRLRLPNQAGHITHYRFTGSVTFSLTSCNVFHGSHFHPQIIYHHR